MAEHRDSRTLTERSQAGDREAFDQLVADFQRDILSYIASRAKFYTGSRLDTEEILQETFVRAYESIGRFEWRDDDSFFKWLCGIAKNVLLQTIKRARNSAPIEKIQEIPASSASPSRVLRREERRDRLERSLATLSGDYREVIYLSRIEGLSTKEVARRMNRSPNAVSHLIARALTVLKAQFGDTESLGLPEHPLLRADGEDEG